MTYLSYNLMLFGLQIKGEKATFRRLQAWSTRKGDRLLCEVLEDWTNGVRKHFAVRGGQMLFDCIE
jgi:hypothetical protein